MLIGAKKQTSIWCGMLEDIIGWMDCLDFSIYCWMLQLVVPLTLENQHILRCHKAPFCCCPLIWLCFHHPKAASPSQRKRGSSSVLCLPLKAITGSHNKPAARFWSTQKLDVNTSRCLWNHSRGGRARWAELCWGYNSTLQIKSWRTYISSDAEPKL